MRRVWVVASCLLAALVFCDSFDYGAEDGELKDMVKDLQKQLQEMKHTVDAQNKKIETQDKALKEVQMKNASIKADESAGKYGGGGGGAPSGDQPRGDGGRLRSWEMTVTVEDNKPGGLREEEKVGKYGQPRWTTKRRFGETRSYVRQEGAIQFEYWNKVEVPRKGDTEVETQYELEFGLPYRFQLDLYAIAHEGGHTLSHDSEPAHGDAKFMKFDRQQVELRWAWANWDVIPGNPTSYIEYISNDGAPDHFETKLLFSGEAAPRWHWAANLVYETELGGEHENTYEFTSGVSYTVKDEKLSIGLEEKLAFATSKFDRRGLNKPELLLGPSIQYRPLKQAHLDFAALAGLTEQSPVVKTVLIFGWEF